MCCQNTPIERDKNSTKQLWWLPVPQVRIQDFGHADPIQNLVTFGHRRRSKLYISSQKRVSVLLDSGGNGSWFMGWAICRRLRPCAWEIRTWGQFCLFVCPQCFPLISILSQKWLILVLASLVSFCLIYVPIVHAEGSFGIFEGKLSERIDNVKLFSTE